jgi:phosphate-selective porin OprO/OprP
LGGGPIFFHGFYISGGWFLTGEHRPYQEANGTFGPVKVNRPVFCRSSDSECDTGWGAWEFASRFAYVDLKDPDTPTGPGGQLIGIQLTEFTVGLNWYLTHHVRLIGNYSCALPNEPNAGTSVAHIFGMRIGLFW